MLNYANLNDVEFEYLCKDIMERMLSVSLRRFAPGRDGGVDLTNDVSTKSIVVQIKHYRNSTTEQLVRSLKSELNKVTELAPQQYYICCSRELSAPNINELYQHFQDYMSSDRHIITLIEIDDFLKKNSNKDILKKHFKLWLDDTGILQELANDKIFVDCDAFLDDADELHKLFVRTSAYDRALQALEKNQILCIVGDPGVGKSITSKMLTLYYASQGYRVRYTSSVTDLGSLKASLRNDPEAKEIILLDDCFGQAYFEMKSTQGTELLSLIRYVKRHPNKILILNSRITIFQEARQRQRDLVRCMEQKDFKVHLLDINELSDEEKAKILYNHLCFSGIPDDYFEDIKADYRYRRIINHKNYNPRIIEFVCSPSRYKTIPSNEFFLFIKKHLDNPSEIWKDEYEYRLQPEDRILLQTIYSLTNTTVNAEIVRQCFERRISKIQSIDRTLDQFGRALQRLNEGFIKILDNKGVKELSMQNPSVNDFLDGRLLRDSAEHTELLSSICMVKQLRLLPRADMVPYVVELVKTDRIAQFIFHDPQERTAIIGYCILAGSLCMEKYRPELLDYLMHRHYSSYIINSPLPGLPNIRAKISNTEIWNYYDLKTFFEESDNLYHFLNLSTLDEAANLICSIDGYFHGKNRISYIQQVDNYLVEAIEAYLIVDASDYEMRLDIDSAVASAMSCGYDDCDINVDEAIDILDECVREEVFREFRRFITTLPKHFWHLADNITADDFQVEGSDNLVEDYLSNPPGHYESDDDSRFDDQSTYSPIDAIFQR